MFQKIFVKLLQERGISTYRLTKDTGISNGLINGWTKGTGTPSGDNLVKLADYLGVSTDYLLTGKEPTAPALSDAEQNLLQLFRQLPPVEQGRIIGRMEAMAEAQK